MPGARLGAITRPCREPRLPFPPGLASSSGCLPYEQIYGRCARAPRSLRGPVLLKPDAVGCCVGSSEGGATADRPRVRRGLERPAAVAPQRNTTTGSDKCNLCQNSFAVRGVQRATYGAQLRTVI